MAASVGISRTKRLNPRYIYSAVQLGSIRRGQLQPSLGAPTGAGFTEIRPSGFNSRQSHHQNLESLLPILNLILTIQKTCII